MLAARRQARATFLGQRERATGSSDASPTNISRPSSHLYNAAHQSSSRGPTLLFLSGECVRVCVLSNLYFGYSSSLRISTPKYPTVGPPVGMPSGICISSRGEPEGRIPTRVRPTNTDTQSKPRDARELYHQRASRWATNPGARNSKNRLNGGAFATSAAAAQDWALV